MNQPVVSIPAKRVEVQMVQGPLDPELLWHICNLYGANVDRRYADPGFARKVFNDNPIGYSYHAFLRAGDEVIGCYTTVPYVVSGRGETICGGKGEALYVRADYRPYGITLVRRMLDYVAEEGVDPVFGLTRERVGRLLELLGFRAIPFRRHYRVRLLRPWALRALQSHKLRLTGACGLMAMQAMLGCTAFALCQGSDLSVEVNRAEHLSIVLEQISESWRPTQVPQLSVATDVKSLRWLVALGILDVLTFEGRSDEYVTVMHCGGGRNVEVGPSHFWRGGLPRAARVLQLIATDALRKGTSVFSVPTDVGSGGRDLVAAASLLGFAPRTSEGHVYVKSNNKAHFDTPELDHRSFISL